MDQILVNINGTTGLSFGYISANALDPEVLDRLQEQGENLTYKTAKAEAESIHDAAWAEKLIAALDAGESEPEKPDFDEQAFNDSYEGYEEIHEGEHDKVKYRTSWLGGALNVWIFDSPYVTHLARAASPCVPGAAILDTLDGNTTGYDVPPDWRAAA